MVYNGLYHGYLYTIINLNMWALTTFNCFRIGAHIQEITCVWKVTLEIKHPVYLPNGDPQHSERSNGMENN